MIRYVFVPAAGSGRRGIESDLPDVDKGFFDRGS